MKTKIAILLGLATILSSPAWAQDNCLRMDQIWNWKAVNNKTLIVENLRHQKFKMTLMGDCINIVYKQRLAFKSVGGTELSCLGDGDEVFVNDIAVPQRCPITSVNPYTPAMQKADEAAAAAAKAQPNAQ